MIGTRRNPGLQLRFKGRDLLPRAVKLNKVRRPGLAPLSGPPTMLDWVRRLPGRTWDADNSVWVATALGPDPDKALADAEFTVDISRAARAGITSLADLIEPWVELATDVPARLEVGVGLDETSTVIWPRLTGYEECVKSVPAAARWVKDPGCWVARTADMVGVTGLPVPHAVRELAKDLDAQRKAGGADASTAALSADLARAIHIDHVRGAADQLIDVVGDVPDWFGSFELFGYQAAGSLAVASGHNYLVDEPGLGKTIQALAAAAIHHSQRVVVICPPVVNTNWAREAAGSHLVEHMPDAEPRPVLALVPELPAATEAGKRKKKPKPPAPVVPFVPGGRIVRIVSGRKEPEFPKTGMLVVSDSLLAARPALLERICAWSPDAVLVDEVHRAKTFDSARATASRTVATVVGAGLRVPITGTPVFASPADLAAALAISGHLDTVFGGLSQFLQTYCVQNFFKAWVAREEMMPQLLAILEAHVWTRRTKADVLPDLPKKFRSGVFLDVDLAGFRAAHADVELKVDEWLESFEATMGRLPTGPEASDEKPAGAGGSEVETWARGSVGLISPLRRAAGMAKVDAAVDRIREHVEATTDDSGRAPVYTRPLIVWVHHREVGDAMAIAVPAAVARTEIIRGGTSADNRGRIVDDFQGGKIPVLVASISAAGVGITLTASSDMMFVETDWTVSNVTQSEDRSCRIGQTRPVMINTLIAEGTLDERIQGVLQTKTVLLDQLLPGGDNAPAIAGIDGDKATTPSAIITDIAVNLIAGRAKGRRKRAA